MNWPNSFPSIPMDTKYAAQAAYSRDNFFLVVGDRLGRLLAGVDQDGAQKVVLRSQKDKPSLALVTIFQFMESLSDPQAVESTRTRIDWKYALHLSMNYRGLPAKCLCEYRQQLLQEPERLQDIQLVLDRLTEDELLIGDQHQRILAYTVLGKVCSVTRSDRVFHAMEITLGTLATQKPGWLQTISRPHWYSRYQVSNAVRHLRLESAEQFRLIEGVGDDVFYLLDCFAGNAGLIWSQPDEIRALYSTWLEQYERLPTGETKFLERCTFCGNAQHGEEGPGEGKN